MKRPVLLCVLVFLAGLATAGADTIVAPGDTFVTRFHTNPPFLLEGQPIVPDFLGWTFWPPDVPTFSAPVSYIARVYDGQVLLGSSSGSATGFSDTFGFFTWVGADSSPALPPAPTIDAVSLLDGTIDGRYEVELTGGGQIWMPDGARPVVMLLELLPDGHGGLANALAWAASETTVVPSQPVPEPTSMLLLGTSLVAARAWRRRTRGD